MIWRCVICFVFVGLTLKSLLSHINSAHSRSPDFRVVCGIDGCVKEYRVYNSLWYHIRRSHSEHLDNGNGGRSQGAKTSTSRSSTRREPMSVADRNTSNIWEYRPSDAMLEDRGRPTENATVGNRSQPMRDAAVDMGAQLVEDTVIEDNTVQPCQEHAGAEHFGSFDNVSLFSGFDHGLHTSPRQPSLSQSIDNTLHIPVACPNEVANGTISNQSKDDSCQNALTRQATAIMLTAREKHRLSQSGVNDVLAAMQQYQALLVTNLRSRLQKVFQQQQQGGELEKEAMAVFDNLEDPFASVSTAYKQDSIIKENFNFVESEEVSVGYKACMVKKGRKRVLATVPKCFHYIPLIKSLEQLLSHPKVLAMIDEPQKYSGAYLCDITDGELMKSHPLFSVRPSALQIILYSDEIEICNPLGSHASKNKLLMFYYTLGNINPKYRSKLAAIRLLAIAKKSELSESGVDGILVRLLEDLVTLYDGVQIRTGDGEREIFGALVSICGDTLAQHELCGFKEGVGFAYSKCRQCECSFEDMQINYDEENFEVRTIERHIRQCSDIEKASTEYLKTSLKTTYGINRRSKLVDFPAFNLIEQTPQDVMHIILEGIAPLEIKCVMKQLILLGHLDLDVFNSALTGFPYSPLDIRDKPSPIAYSTLASNDNKLKQSSGQMIVLLKILPFLIDKVKGTDYYTIILELIEIVQILFAPVIGLQTINKLKTLIELHLKHVKKLFPDNNITPKQHYLIHIPSQIKKLGPMVRHMCMRFESKHCFFKQWASKINFRNVCKSLIRHNQMYECCQNVSSFEHPIFSNECTLGPTSEISNMSYLKEKMQVFLGNDEVNHAVSVKWINLNGNKYMRDKSLIFSAVNSDNVPEFGLVRNIYVINSSLYCFEFQPHSTICYDTDYMAYKIEIPNMAQATELISSDKLVDFTPFYSFTHKDMTYVTTKYYLGDVIGLNKASPGLL